MALELGAHRGAPAILAALEAEVSAFGFPAAAPAADQVAADVA